MLHFLFFSFVVIARDHFFIILIGDLEKEGCSNFNWKFSSVFFLFNLIFLSKKKLWCQILRKFFNNLLPNQNRKTSKFFLKTIYMFLFISYVLFTVSIAIIRRVNTSFCWICPRKFCWTFLSIWTLMPSNRSAWPAIISSSWLKFPMACWTKLYAWNFRDRKSSMSVKC